MQNPRIGNRNAELPRRTPVRCHSPYRHPYPGYRFAIDVAEGVVPGGAGDLVGGARRFRDFLCQAAIRRRIPGLGNRASDLGAVSLVV